MPDWLVVALTVLLLSAWGIGTWTLWEAFLNWMAVRRDESLVDHARNHLWRLTALWLALGGLSVIGVLSFTPRTTVTRMVSSVATVLMALALAGVSYHEYAEMRMGLDEE